MHGAGRVTSTDVAVRPQQALELSNDQLSYIAGTEFVPPGLRGNLPAILACVATGRALGIADMTALRSIHVIDGKATFSAELMVMLARQRGHSITGEVSEGSATVTGRRRDNGDTMTVTWTMQMADRAGLTNKQNWRKYPESMLWARAVSQLCRELFADCFAGATYTPEELGADDPPPATGDPAEGTPFSDGWEDHPDGYTPAEPVPLASAAQKRKLNVLVGKLRPERVTTEQLWNLVAFIRQVPPWSEIKRLNADPEDLHWSPLRESLTKAEASALIEHLTALESSAGEPQAAAAAVSQATDPGEPASPADLTKRLLAYAVANQKRDEVEDAINRHRASADDAAHLEWLRKQVARIPEAAA
jgi:hypothetical protein